MIGRFLLDQLPNIIIPLNRLEGPFEPGMMGEHGADLQCWRGPLKGRGRVGKRIKVPTETLQSINLSEVRLYCPFQEGEERVDYREGVRRARLDGLEVLDPWAMAQILIGEGESFVPVCWKGTKGNHPSILTFPELVDIPVEGQDDGLPNSRHIVHCWFSWHGKEKWYFEPWMHSIQGGYDVLDEGHVFATISQKYLDACRTF